MVCISTSMYAYGMYTYGMYTYGMHTYGMYTYGMYDDKFLWRIFGWIYLTK